MSSAWKRLQEKILDKYIEMAENAGLKVCVIRLTMDKNGVPQGVYTRFDTQRLFIDPIFLPVKVPNAQVQAGNIFGAVD
ncbi:MAG: hypothetical protein ACYTBV_19635 [Planctomycetota bacterium]|jgi:hypothetical protein